MGKVDGVVEALKEREAIDEVHPRAARRPDIRDDQVYAVRLPPNGRVELYGPIFYSGEPGIVYEARGKTTYGARPDLRVGCKLVCILFRW